MGIEAVVVLGHGFASEGLEADLVGVSELGIADGSVVAMSLAKMIYDQVVGRWNTRLAAG